MAALARLGSEANGTYLSVVFPAKAGIQCFPLCLRTLKSLDSRFRGNDEIDRTGLSKCHSGRRLKFPLLFFATAIPEHEPLSSGRRPRHGAVRHGDVDPALRQRAQLGCKHAGRKVATLQTIPADNGSPEGDAGKVGGFSLHAGVAAEAHEGQKLERLCRYIARPAISEKRLSLSPQARVG